MKKRVENFVHEGLEGHRRARQVKRHNKELGEALVGAEGHFLHVVGLLHFPLIVPPGLT
jgi:hypothetical protein